MNLRPQQLSDSILMFEGGCSEAIVGLTIAEPLVYDDATRGIHITATGIRDT